MNEINYDKYLFLICKLATAGENTKKSKPKVAITAKSVPNVIDKAFRTNALGWFRGPPDD